MTPQQMNSLDWCDLRVLVTRGTGSLGNFVRYLLQLGAKEVRVFSRDEKKQYDVPVFYVACADILLCFRSEIKELVKGEKRCAY